MQTLNTVEQLRNQFNIVPDIGNQRLSFCLLASRRTLKSWVGAEKYEDAYTSDLTHDERRDALISAEANLAMYHLLLNTGARIRPFPKNPADSGRSEYLPPAELQELRKKFFDTAAELAEPYRVNPPIGTVTMQMRPAYLASETESDK